MSSDYRVLLCTAPPDEARSLAHTLVKQRLAACVNVLPGVASVYWWEGELHEDDEVLLIIKTTAARLPELSEQLIELHPYDVPELVALPIHEDEGNPKYLSWIRAVLER